MSTVVPVIGNIYIYIYICPVPNATGVSGCCRRTRWFPICIERYANGACCVQNYYRDRYYGVLWDGEPRSLSDKLMKGLKEGMCRAGTREW